MYTIRYVKFVRYNIKGSQYRHVFVTIKTQFQLYWIVIVRIRYKHTLRTIFHTPYSSGSLVTTVKVNSTKILAHKLYVYFVNSGFWAVRLSIRVIDSRSLGGTYRLHLQRSRNPRRHTINFAWHINIVLTTLRTSNTSSSIHHLGI
jgi:hypothetical protein